MKCLPIVLILFLGGCANVEPGKTTLATRPSVPSKPVVLEQEITTERDALQILFNEGLAEEAQYDTARFIEGSNQKMIIASVQDVPCQLIFRFVEASNGDFWIPSQIACDNQESMLGFIPDGEVQVISSTVLRMVNSG